MKRIFTCSVFATLVFFTANAQTDTPKKNFKGDKMLPLLLPQK